MRVLISGAGIAGLTAAFWLKQLRHEPIVVEKAKNIRTEGYMIDFGGTGWDVADRMGLINALNEKAHHFDEIHYKNIKGDTSSKIALTQLYKAANVEGKFMVINRSDIVLVLYEAIKDLVEIRFDTTIEAVCQSKDNVQVTFNDNTSESFDILIGADGIHSNVRQLIFGKEDFFSNYLGYSFAVFMAPKQDYHLENAYEIYVEPGVQFGVYPFSDDEWMIYVVNKCDNPSPIPASERLELLRKTLPHDAWIIGDIMDSLPDDIYIYQDYVSQIQVPHWWNNRVVLIGDSAYCPTLVSGQGASMAMAGAYFLAQDLQNFEEPQQAFEKYERTLRPHIEKIQTSARRFAPNFVPKSNFRIQIINWILRLSNFSLIRNLIGKQLTLESIIDKHQPQPL